MILRTLCHAVLGAIVLATAGAAGPGNATETAWERWGTGRGASGTWLGLRDRLEDRGLTIEGQWVGVFYGVIASERGARGFFDQEIAFGGTLDVSRFLGVPALQGLQGFGNVRYRQGTNPNDFVLASGNFQPSHMESGEQWRVLSFGLAYTAPEMFGIDNFLTFSGGWLQPQLEFITQPLSKLFVNSAFESSKGIGANIPFSSSFSTWGGVLTLRPVDWYYAKGALFMAYPQAADSANHGLAYAGYAPNPGSNALMAMCETGFTPEIGPDKLAGKYVFGSYWYGQDGSSYHGAPTEGFYGFYWQLDQELFRESPPSPPDAKQTLAARGPEPEPQGLSAFNLFTFSPGYNQPLAFYFHSGLVYRGLVPGRDRDQFLAAIGAGTYSVQNIRALQSSGNRNQPNFTAVIELGYRIPLNAWSHVQPYGQFLVKPYGTESIGNAAILGVMCGISF
ncbi:MAG TPA: carbohydrate porin [Terrimicrobiaceae bacterium]|nr:carbohydrate porin [Terrimicrobiaceae bacterium]